KGRRIGLLICEDVWYPQPAAAAVAAGAELLLVINASPFHTEQHVARSVVLEARVRETRRPIVYLNLVGGQDELVFDGASQVWRSDGSIAQQLPAFREALALVRIEAGEPRNVRGEIGLPREALVYEALCLGVHDYVTKNGFPGVLLGLSGGIDSALTLAIAVDALGADKVRAIMLPSPYTRQISLDDSRAMVNILGVRYSEFPIDDLFQGYLGVLKEEFAGRAVDATEENIQARIRGTLMMALSNKYGAIVLTTGNKSEMAVGYATLYGDMAGGFAVLKDIAKTLVYRLASYRNDLGRVIPERIITRAPSAELRPDQTDQDSLPPYEVLDAILEAYVEQDKSPQDIVALGYAAADVRKVVRLIKLNEYKRRQAAVGIRITPRGFGRDWRYPITSRYRDWDELSPG
ncbi:MAG: NAD+ synthase, partial [Burkholderiales bacterium]